jgi:SAM-dependent methyltransferase
MKTATIRNEEIREGVREQYGQIAGRTTDTVANGSRPGCGCAPTCCGSQGSDAGFAETLGYSESDLAAVPEGANLGLGCGNPVALASLLPGQTVLDLGSGGGFDAFLAARAVTNFGKVVGVDMTSEMVGRARRNQEKGNFRNVDFRLGEIEHLPVADGTVDVIISNCVINLSPDKQQVFREAFRVLKPGGRLTISDIVALHELPEEVRMNFELHTGCVAGAAVVGDLERWLREVGFEDIRIHPKQESRRVLGELFPGKGLEDLIASATVEATKPKR